MSAIKAMDASVPKMYAITVAMIATEMLSPGRDLIKEK